MQHVRVLLDDHALRHPHAPVAGDSPHVVAPQVQQHQVLGALLGVGEEVLRQRGVLLRAPAAAARSRDGAHRHGPLLQPHHHLRRRAHQLEAVQLQVEQVRRGVEGAQRPVQVEGGHLQREREPLREHHLEGVPGADVVLHPLHRRLEAAARKGAAEGRVLRRGRRHGQRRRAGAALDPGDGRLHLRGGRVVAPAQLRIVRAPGLHRGDGARPPEQVVHRHHHAGEHEHGVRQPQPLRRRVGEPLHVADDVVAEEAHRPAPEARQPRHLGGGVPRHQPAEVGERVGGALPGGPPFPRRPAVDAVSHQPPRPARLRPQEGVARPALPARHRLQQEAEGRARELVVRGHRGVRVEEELAGNGNERRLACQPQELGEGGVELHAVRAVRGAGNGTGNLPRPATLVNAARRQACARVPVAP